MECLGAGRYCQPFQPARQARHVPAQGPRPAGLHDHGNERITGSSVRHQLQRPSQPPSQAHDLGVVRSVTAVVGSRTSALSSPTPRPPSSQCPQRRRLAAGDADHFMMTALDCQRHAGHDHLAQATGARPGRRRRRPSRCGPGLVVVLRWNRLRLSIGFHGSTRLLHAPSAASLEWSIPYWFLADGRRVIIVAKITTVYEHAYLGFLDAYATPGEWTYPLVVGVSDVSMAEPGATSANWNTAM